MAMGNVLVERSRSFMPKAGTFPKICLYLVPFELIHLLQLHSRPELVFKNIVQRLFGRRGNKCSESVVDHVVCDDEPVDVYARSMSDGGRNMTHAKEVDLNLTVALESLHLELLDPQCLASLQAVDVDMALSVYSQCEQACLAANCIWHKSQSLDGFASLVHGAAIFQR